MNKIKKDFKNDSFIKVPRIYWSYTSKQIMALDRVDAISIRDLEALKKEGIDLNKLSRNLIQLFLKLAVRDGFFHADMHQGNLFVDAQGNLIPIDFGIMGRLDKNNKKFSWSCTQKYIKK